MIGRFISEGVFLKTPKARPSPKHYVLISQWCDCPLENQNMNSNPNIDIATLVKNHLAAKKWDMHAQPEVVETAIQAVSEKLPDLIEEIVDHDFMAQACFGHSRKRRYRKKDP